MPVIDADQLARVTVAPGSPAVKRITELFGGSVLAADGSLDRKKVGDMVFASASRRRQLEEILHPEIRRLAEERIANAAVEGHKIVVYMAPLLIEAGVSDRVAEIWVVTVSPEVQLERLMRRENISRDEASGIIASQMPLAEKERYGKVVIDNSGTPEETRRILDEIWERETGSIDE